MSCQLQEIREIEVPNSHLNDLFQVRVKILRKMKRIALFAANTLSGTKARRDPSALRGAGPDDLRPGDSVRVRSKEEINSTLNAWGEYRGCRFIDEMYDYCGKSFTVLKQVDYFYDEVSRKLRRCRDTVVLSGALCSGRQRLYSVSCDRNCFFFWQTAWLEKIDADRDSVPQA